MTEKYGAIIKYAVMAVICIAVSVAFVIVAKTGIIPVIDLTAPAREEFNIKTEEEVLEDLLGDGDVSAIVQNEYEKYMASLPKAVTGFAENYVKGETVIAYAENYSNPAEGTNRNMPVYGGNTSIPAGYVCTSGENGVLLLSRNGKYGYYSESGYWITSPEYEEAYAFSSGLAVVKKGGLYGVIDADGKTVIPFLFDGIGDAETGGMTVYKRGQGYSRIAFVKKG